MSKAQEEKTKSSKACGHSSQEAYSLQEKIDTNEITIVVNTNLQTKLSCQVQKKQRL